MLGPPVFSRDSARLLTFFENSDYFAVWSVSDGQLLAVNHPGDEVAWLERGFYKDPDFGVPGSASDGLIGFGSVSCSTVDLWDVSPPPEAGACRPRRQRHSGPSQPRRRIRLDLAPHHAELDPDEGDPDEDKNAVDSFAFSRDGSKFAAAYRGTACHAYVYDVASLMRLGAYTSSFASPDQYWGYELMKTSWAPDGQHVLVFRESRASGTSAARRRPPSPP